jgi:hypothetical protein
MDKRTTAIDALIAAEQAAADHSDVMAFRYDLGEATKAQLLRAERKLDMAIRARCDAEQAAPVTTRNGRGR